MNAIAALKLAAKLMMLFFSAISRMLALQGVPVLG